MGGLIATSAGFVPCPTGRLVAAGAGSEGLSQPQICDTILALSGKDKPSVLYIGTATYDLPGPREKQTALFIERGCPVVSLSVADATPTAEELQRAFDSAEVVIVSGGNTLFAVDRWVRLGINELLRQALERGVVLSGGSAGAICWFDAGHSDSMDPTSFKRAMLRRGVSGADESSEAPASEAEKKSWEYIRVPALSFLPGLLCPHHDRTQSNGVLRSEDFNKMLLRHPGETGIGIDHWAALVVEGENYRVVSLENKGGSVVGKPGIWRKQARLDGSVHSEVVPPSGKVADLLCPATEIVQDARVELVRRANPDDLP